MFCVDFQHLAGAYRPSSFCTTAASRLCETSCAIAILFRSVKIRCGFSFSNWLFVFRERCSRSSSVCHPSQLISLFGEIRPCDAEFGERYGEGSTVQIRRNTFRSRRSSLSRACCRGLSTEQFCPVCTIVLRLRLKTRHVKRIILVCLYVSYSPHLIVQTMLHVIDGMCLKLHVVFLLIVWFSQWSWK